MARISFMTAFARVGRHRMQQLNAFRWALARPFASAVHSGSGPTIQFRKRHCVLQKRRLRNWLARISHNIGASGRRH